MRHLIWCRQTFSAGLVGVEKSRAGLIFLSGGPSGLRQSLRDRMGLAVIFPSSLTKLPESVHSPSTRAPLPLHQRLQIPKTRASWPPTAARRSGALSLTSGTPCPLSSLLRRAASASTSTRSPNSRIDRRRDLVTTTRDGKVQDGDRSRCCPQESGQSHPGRRARRRQGNTGGAHDGPVSSVERR